MSDFPSQIPMPFSGAGKEGNEKREEKQLDGLSERIEKRIDERKIAAGLPFVPPNKGGLPNGALRSALFGISNKDRRHYSTERHIASVKGVEVFITRGPNLQQHHLDVWEYCLRLARGQGTGKPISFSTYSFLKGITRNTGKTDMEWLKDCFYDLAGCIVRISDGSKTYFGPLIKGGTRDDETGQYVIEINPSIALLFGEGKWTQLDYSQRNQLRKAPLAQWLHAFYSTHLDPFDIKVETIQHLCGADPTVELKKFRQNLRRALEKLQTVTGWACSINKQDCVVIAKKRALESGK
jgi:hypothetical protein